MKKNNMLFTILLICCFVISCSKGNDLVGKYKNGDYYVLIDKAGDNNFSINTNVSNGGYSNIAEYKEGCLYSDTKIGKRVIFCKTDKGLVSFNGIKLTKEK